MTDLTDIKNNLVRNVRFQQTPIAYTDADYWELIKDAAKRLYVDEGIYKSFQSDYSETLSGSDITNITLIRDLTLTEQEYIEVVAEIGFYNQIKNSWNTLVSYTTDALSVAGLGNVFKYIDGTSKDLENRLSDLAFHFTHRSE